MDLATGAMGSLLPKLAEFLQEEYKLQTGVKKDVESLSRELRSIEVALSKVAEVPRDQLNKQVRLWADEVRELSYQMEDVVDSFLVRVEGSERAGDPCTFKGFMKKVAKLFKKVKKVKTRHQIANAIKDIKDQVQEVAARRKRYEVDDVLHLICTVHANPAATNTVDPRMLALFKDQRQLVGIEEPRDELIKRLTDRDDGVSKQQLTILSIFGLGGLGKTTLAKAVYDKLHVKFDCKAFVSVGQNPSTKKVLMDILRQLGNDFYLNATMLDEKQLIEELRGLLENKRYLIVVDDIWDIKSWEIIRCALVDRNRGSIIITTTRILEVAKETGHVYKHESLSRGNSIELFYKRLSIGKGKYSFDHTVEISEKILQKCGGVPLAIVTIASLLADKPSEDWSEVYNSIGFGQGDNVDVDNTKKILLFSYYDLPCYLRTCLLHLSIYPEDQEIKKKNLIWKWVGEGFVREKPGTGLFELGERYFNELINRSMIQPLEKPHQGIVYACRVHDLVLDMIYSLSKEENFVVVLGSNEQHTCPQSNARRMAVQRRVRDLHNPMANTPMRQVRSFYVTMCHLSMMPSLSSFQALRVLAIEDCTYMKGCPYNLKHLGKLLQLRYLRLVNTPISELPEEIRDLRFLQTLDLRQIEIQKLPRSVGQLSQLKCLRLVGDMISVSDWIGNLTSLEEVSLDYAYGNCMKELGKLTELRVFKTKLRACDPELLKDMMDSLGNMQRLQALHIDSQALDIETAETLCDGYVLSRHLRHVKLEVGLPRLPAWIDSSHLPLLSHLDLCVDAVQAKDVEILGKLPELLILRVMINGTIFPDVIGGGAFPKLRYFYVNAKLRFLQGAMPSLESVAYHALSDFMEADSLERDFASLGNLPCLQKVSIRIHHFLGLDSEEAKAAWRHGMAVLRHAVKVHPNNPTFEEYKISARAHVIKAAFRFKEAGNAPRQ